MTTNAGIVSDALKFVQRKKEQLDTLQNLDERVEDTAEAEGQEDSKQQQQTTKNEVF